MTVIVALPGQYFMGRKTALRSLIQPQAPLTFLTRPSSRMACTVRCVSTTSLSGIARVKLILGRVPTPSLVREPSTPRLLLAALKVAFTHARGLGSVSGFAGS